jgi:hypothetical protein
MNFLAHAEVARRSGGDADFVLGAVLPDLLPMAGVRLDREGVPAGVAAGWRAHHAADAAFHASSAFAGGVQALRTDLRHTALATGPRRAVAHVGWELLLDDAVAGDPVTVDAFRAVLARARPLTDDLRWHHVLDRFAAIRPTGSTDAMVVAERVRRACSRRPRLAFDVEHLPAVAAVLAEHRDAVLHVAPTLLAQVAAAVE